MSKKHYLKKFYKTLFGTLFLEFLIAYASFRGYQFFYPQSNGDLTYEGEESLDVDLQPIPVMTADTELIIEEISAGSDLVNRYRQAVPDYYLGMDRNALSKQVSMMKEAPSLTEQEKGLYDMELNTFSSGRVIIRKYYKAPEKSGYYLVVKNHYISVYNATKQNCLQDTSILLEQLPDLLQKQIIEGKFIEDQESLYNFLETYTS